MTGRIWLAGIVGGVVLFIWLSIAHILTPLGRVGFKKLPNEAATLGALKASLADEGLYFYPWMEDPRTIPPAQRDAAMKEFQEKFAAGPHGLLLYHPAGTGTGAMQPRQLLIEFFKNLLESLFAVFLLTRTAGLGFGGRVAFVSVVGLIAATSTNLSYWNWYGFPSDYSLAYVFTTLVGYILIGLTAALFLRGTEAKAAVAAQRA